VILADTQPMAQSLAQAVDDLAVDDLTALA
jgi:hypothetical protein